MVSHTGGYHGAPFNGYWEVIQGGALLSTLFNVVVITVVRDWLSLVAAEEAGP